MDIDTTEGFVYLAGKYRAKDGTHDWSAYEEIARNISLARTWAMRLASDNIPMFCPHLNSAHAEVIAPNVHPDYWYRLDMQILANAQAIFLLPGWKDSYGARDEHAFAEDNHLGVFYAEPNGLDDEWASYDGLVRWWKENNAVYHS